MPASVILRQDRAGRLTIHRPPQDRRRCAPNPLFEDARAAEAEASRARFRDDHAWYCVYTGFFRDLGDATLFCAVRNKGGSIERAMQAVRARQT
jgi:hypothetical protein